MRTTLIALVIVAMSIAVTARADDERVTVKIVGSAGTDIEQATLDDSASVTWTPLCTAPCSARVPRDSVLRALGGLPSEPIKLGATDTKLIAMSAPSSRADASNALIGVGVTLLVGATIALPVAAGLAFDNAFKFCFSGCSFPNRTPQDVLFVTGTASAVLGGALLIAGFAIRPSARAMLVVAGRGVAARFEF